MKILLLGYERYNLKLMDYIVDRSTIIDAVGYDNVSLDSRINKRMLGDVNINDYKVIFLGDYLSNEHRSLFDSLKNDDVLLFQGLRTVEPSSIKSDLNSDKVDEIIKTLIETLPYDIAGANVFVIGFDPVAYAIVAKLREIGANVRVGTMSKREFEALISNNIPCIYTDNMDTIKKLIEIDEVVVNTIGDLNIGEDIEKYKNVGNHIINTSQIRLGKTKKL